MNLGRIVTAPCNNTPPLPDARCNDPVFALLNPNICGTSSQLIIKPSVALCCLLGGVQFKAVVVSNGQEKDVTAQTTFTTSNPDVAVVGATSGNATGVGDGESIITATYSTLTSSASMSVLGDGVGCSCCDDIRVGLMVLLDISQSMTQSFGGSYSRKLDFGKAAAKRFIGEINGRKDVVGLATFDDSAYTQLSGLVSTPATVAAMVDAINSIGQLTGYKAAVNAAIATLNAASVDNRVLVVISDGADTSKVANDASDTLTALNAFKASGGSVIVLGTRTAGMEFSFLETFSTGGFFVNSYSAVAVDALNFFSGIKGYVCAGNCVPAGDDFEAKGQLNYCGFKNWTVRGGHVDLIGNQFLDFLPGNGLYVDLAGADAPHGGIMESKVSYALTKDHAYRLSLNLAGNQRAAGAPNTVNMRIFGRNNDGLSNPAAAPVPTVNNSGAALSTTPTYKYVYTYTNANGETAPSPSASATPTTANATISVQTTASASATAINIYRTTGATPDSAYYLIATIAPTAPAYVDHMNEADMLAAFLAGTLDACAVAPTTNTTGSQVNYLNQSVTINDYQQPFLPQSFTFTAPDNISVWISFQQTATPAGAPSAGLLLDNVSFDDATNIVNLLADNFTNENLVYVAPACGSGMFPYQTTGFQYVNSSVPATLPVMTSNTAPLGVVSDSNNEAHAYDPLDGTGNCHGNFLAGPGTNPAWWIQYRFLVPGYLYTNFKATSYTMKLLTTGSVSGVYQFPLDWVFQGSNDGSTWTTLDTHASDTSFFNASPVAVTKTFSISNTTAYQYYRLTITHWNFSSGLGSDQGSYFCILSMTGSGNSYFQTTIPTTVTAYGYAYGYCGCYGTGCLDAPPPVQLPDPNPLPNIEAPGYTPPKQFTSTQQACATCGAGTSQVVADDSGIGTQTRVESADGTYFNFVTPPILNIICWTFTGSSAFTLSVNGSNDGINWVKIFLTTGRGFAANPSGDVDVSATTSRASCCTFDAVQYKYFKLVYDKTKATLTLFSFGGVVFSTTQQLCKSATATSLVSQASADASAQAQALALAQATIQCIQTFSATESFTAVCPIGKAGQSVTKTVTYISLISLADAIAQALAQATAQAQAAISCACVDSSAGAIVFKLDTTVTPYPAVKCVSGLTGHITKVTASLTGYQHTRPVYSRMVLVSPKGTIVELFRNCGGNVNVSGVNLVFDDAAGSSLNASTMVSGTFKPTQLGVFAAYLQPCPSGTPSNTLAAFIGEDPNGAWTLYGWTILTADGGQIVGGFSLNITSV